MTYMEKGTELICVDNSGAESSLTLGKVYEVKDVLTVSRCVCVDSDSGFVEYFWPERFDTLSIPAKEHSVTPEYD